MSKRYTIFSDNPKMDTSGRWDKAQSLKSGGPVRGKTVPAAYLDGNVIMQAAKRAGLDVSKNPSTDAQTRNTLNMVVDLINSGMSPDAAAKLVANDRQIYKAGGVVYLNKEDDKTKVPMDELPNEEGKI